MIPLPTTLEVTRAIKKSVFPRLSTDQRARLMAQLEQPPAESLDTVDKIISEMETYRGVAPVTAFDAASQRKDEVLTALNERLLGLHQALETQGETDAPVPDIAPALYWLASTRSSEANPGLYQLLGQDEPFLDMVLGDVLTESLPHILFHTHDDVQTQPLFDLARRRDFGMLVWSTLHAIAMLTLADRTPRELVTELLQELLEDWMPRNPDTATNECWNALYGITYAASSLGLTEFLPRLEPVISHEEFVSMWGTPAEFLAHAEESSQMKPSEILAHELKSLEDPVLALQNSWLGYKPEERIVQVYRHLRLHFIEYEKYAIKGTSPADDRSADALSSFEVRREFRKLGEMMDRADAMRGEAPVSAGRNDPCPCGSGRKYKKCCL